MAEVVLKAGHVRPVWCGHPWVYSQGIARTIGNPKPGDEVTVVDPKGNMLGRGLFSPASAIAVRLYTRQAELPFDAGFLQGILQDAERRRAAWGLPRPDTTAYRVLNAEGDGVPGLVVDRFDDVLVLQLSTLGVRQRVRQLVAVLKDEFVPRAILDRTPSEAGKLEGFEVKPGVLSGDQDVSALRVLERGMRFDVPVEMAQKTGFYLDLRRLRARLEELARGRRVLDCYSYVGASGLFMARGGALEVLSVDKSSRAIEVARQAAIQNGLSSTYRAEQGDAFAALERAAKTGGYDLVLCDPPKLAPRRTTRRRAEALLQRLAEAACRATRPGGVVVLCSCSHALGTEQLVRVLALGSRAAGRQTYVVERIHQDVDHPVPAAFPEGLYLSSVLAIVE